MKLKMKMILILISALFVFSGCNRGRIKANPEGSIIFLPYIDKNILGFSNYEGKDIKTYDVHQDFSRPVWSEDGLFIFGLGGHGLIGHPIYWDLEKGRYKRCTDGPFYFQIQGTENPDKPKEVLLQNSSQILIMDLEACQIEKYIVDDDSYKDYFRVLGMSYCPEKRTVAYGLYYDYEEGWRYEIVLYHVDTWDEEVIGLGVNPSWSHDGESIAYFGTDSRLYLMDANGSNVRLLLSYQFFDPCGDLITKARPIIQWSPDDKWIIYHRCDGDNWYDNEMCQIYKLNVETKEEVMIIDQGMYPDWNPSSGE